VSDPEILIAFEHYGERHQNRVQGRGGSICSRGTQNVPIFTMGGILFQTKIDQNDAM
jgi:hypothetical protein